MENSVKFISFQKFIVFGDIGVGKTTLIKFIETNNFKEQYHTENYKL